MIMSIMRLPGLESAPRLPAGLSASLLGGSVRRGLESAPVCRQAGRTSEDEKEKQKELINHG
jgi:hypothetical protein